MQHIILKQVKKTYSGGRNTAPVAALNGISLEIPYGQFLAITGPSGSGKTTLLHLVAGLIPLSSGEIFIENHNIGKMSSNALCLFRRRHLGMIFQDYNLIPTLTVTENILLPVLAGAAPRQEIKAAKEAALLLMKRLGIEKRRNHYPDYLSGGEQQKTAIARALCMDYSGTSHSLILADEPTGNLDSAAGQDFCRILRELCDERRFTIILVTHDKSVAEWADRIISLKDGEITSE